ncbi:MAG: hypothetical protein OEZ39_00015 [Gammaproteobacteria bacterium]|nr:hypothetical protein [Gammaproteobacteria bacterium]
MESIVTPWVTLKRKTTSGVSMNQQALNTVDTAYGVNPSGFACGLLSHSPSLQLTQPRSGFMPERGFVFFRHQK